MRYKLSSSVIELLQRVPGIFSGPSFASFFFFCKNFYKLSWNDYYLLMVIIYGEIGSASLS